MIPSQIGFIGLGLIGGSLAKTIRRLHPSIRLIAVDTDETALEQSKRGDIMDEVYTKIQPSFSKCDWIFLCTPVTAAISYMDELKLIMNPSCILSDVGSVKSKIHQAIQQNGMDSQFIGGHPMTGSEKSGFANATDHLLENAYYIITPSKSVPDELVINYKNFLLSLGTIPLILSYEEHDRITAAVSHLPHIIASSLVNLIQASDSPDEKMKMIAAGGFKDITRIASSSPDVWQQIVQSNLQNIQSMLSDYIMSLQEIQSTLNHNDSKALYELFDTARNYRDSMPNTSLGPIKKIFAFYCDIIDEAGAIATISTILATNHISIKNIGIIHNREFEEGVLRIEFYDSESEEKAVVMLKKYNYTIYSH